MNGTEFTLMDASAIPIISGWVGMLKDVIPDEWKKKSLPLLAILCGMIYAFSIKQDCGGVMESIIMGFTLGLGSVGAHSAVKNGIEKANGVTPPLA